MITCDPGPPIMKKALMKKTNGIFAPDFETMGNPVDLAPGERAVISLIRHTDINEMPYSTYAEFSGDQEYGEIRIAPGEYEMKIDLYYYNYFEIPERTEKIEDEKVTYPSIVFNETNPLPNGGLHCNSTSTAFSITNPNFDSESWIIFKAMSSNLMGIDPEDRRIEDLEQIGKLDDTSYTQYCYALRTQNE